MDEPVIITPPKQPDWEFLALVEEFQNKTNMEPDFREKVIDCGSKLEAPIASAAGKQKVRTKAGTDKKEIVVEYTQGFVQVPYDDFIKVIKPDQWAKHLANYRFGATEIVPGVTVRGTCTETRQIERMSLGTFDLDFSIKLLSSLIKVIKGIEKFTPLETDMTKTEIIRTWPDKSIIYWRVYHSDDKSVIDDLGSLKIEKRDGGTLMTFHSAHDLKVAKYMDVTKMVEHYFVKCIEHYENTARAGILSCS